jgi:hypothetical protein
VALAADHSPLHLDAVNAGDVWDYPDAVNKQLGWKNRFSRFLLEMR